MRSFFQKIKDESQKVLQGDDRADGNTNDRSLETAPEHLPPENHEDGGQSDEGTFPRFDIVKFGSYLFSYHPPNVSHFPSPALSFVSEIFVSFHVMRSGSIAIQYQCHPLTHTPACLFFSLSLSHPANILVASFVSGSLGAKPYLQSVVTKRVAQPSLVGTS